LESSWSRVGVESEHYCGIGLNINIFQIMTAIQLKVFLGDESHVQRDCFYGALNSLGISSHPTNCAVMTFSQLKDKIRFESWTQQTFIDWIGDCDIYVILCHIHQSFGFPPLLWDPLEFYESLYQKLYNRVGFPEKDQLQCPVFTQNKFKYIEAIGSLANPMELDIDYHTYVPDFNE
jgi:hypothetical protein